MKKNWLLGIVWMTVLLISACSLPPSTSSGAGQSKKTLEQPEFKLNPNPKRAYTITVEVVDPPGEFGYRNLGVRYSVANDECSAVPTGGEYSNTLDHHLDYELEKVSENRYEAVIYLDKILDEDYYGKGICIWELESLAATFRRSDQKADTYFSPYMLANDVIREESFTYYFLDEDYPSVAEFPNGWSAATRLDKNIFLPHIKDSDIFEIKIQSKKGVR